MLNDRAERAEEKPFTRRDLNSWYNLAYKIYTIEKAIKDLNMDLLPKSAEVTGMPHGSNVGRPVESATMKRMRAKDKYETRLAVYKDQGEMAKKRIINYIATVPDRQMQLILISRHIKLKPWEIIAGELSKNPSTIKRAYYKFLRENGL